MPPALRLTAALAALAALAGCSAPGPVPELAEAERHRRAGHPQAALRAYRAGQRACVGIRDRLRRRAACADAHLGAAELLVNLGRPRDAVLAFDRAAVALAPDDDRGAGRATLRAGQLTLELGDAVGGYRRLWRVVTRWPELAYAGDALVVLLRDGRARDAAQLVAVLSQLSARLGPTAVGDNLRWALADLAEHERGDPAGARAQLDRLVAEHPRSGLVDDARWHAARLSRALGDPAGAAARLRALLATREVSFGAGSYFSVWLDDGQLELGRVLRDDLGRPTEALAAFARLPRDYPASTLRDDALWERAVTLERLGRRADACAALADLHRAHPDSRWELTEAPARRAALACPRP